MEVEFVDIRALDSTCKNIAFSQHDVMKGLSLRTPSISCLNVIEHFGLGRYEDPIDPEGHLRGFRNMVNALESGGTFFISFPIGGQDRVDFNAHRVFHPESILSRPSAEELTLTDFAFVDDAGDLHPSTSIEEAVAADISFGCGIYTFTKTV